MNLFKLFKSAPKKSREEIIDLLNTGKATLVDVRTVQEFGEGHLTNAENYPLQELNKNIKTLKQYPKPIITVCRSGGRSGIACKMLNSKGIETYNGGAWENLKNQLK